MRPTVYDILRDFHIRKNVEMGMSQNDWIQFINDLEYHLKRRDDEVKQNE